MGYEKALKGDLPPRYTSLRATSTSRPESSRTAAQHNRIALHDVEAAPPPYEEHGGDPFMEILDHDKRVKIDAAIEILKSRKLLEGLVVLLLPSQSELTREHTLTGWRYDSEPKSILTLPEDAGDRDFWEMLEPTMQVRLWLLEQQPHGLVSDIDVRLEEVYFRRETNFGLYETGIWMALVVEIGRVRPDYHGS